MDYTLRASFKTLIWLDYFFIKLVLWNDLWFVAFFVFLFVDTSWLIFLFFLCIYPLSLEPWNYSLLSHISYLILLCCGFSFRILMRSVFWVVSRFYYFSRILTVCRQYVGLLLCSCLYIWFSMLLFGLYDMLSSSLLSFIVPNCFLNCCTHLVYC